jgi:phosphotransferase system enzyme I (PtsI)
MVSLQTSEFSIQGVPICRGIAIGKPFFFSCRDDAVPEFSIPTDEIQEEIQRYYGAINCAREDIQQLQKQLERERILEGSAILDAQLQMTDDPLLTSHVEEEIRNKRKNAEFIFQFIVKQYQKKFNALSDPFFRERFKDLQDISRRVMAYLLESVRVSLAEIPPNSIVFAHELTATDIAEANPNHVSAFVCQTGSSTSHAAIVAKAKGIPYITSVPFASLEQGHSSEIIIDACTGHIIVNPSLETRNKYLRFRDQLQIHLNELEEVKELEPETFDGYKVRLSANIEMVTELDMLHQYGGHGVGLFRSEYIFLSNEQFPTEEEQFLVYKQIVQKMHGLPIIIRTFDVGGDKLLAGQQVQEMNPFLGCRAIRFLLREREIFKAQLRAIIRASAFGDVSIMFPMISNLSELIEAKSVIMEAQSELLHRGELIPSHPLRIGCMIEVPSAAIIADLLAKECDFLSIGTNDLVQYSLAVDRGNHAMSNLYTPTHPSVIRLIKLVVAEANHQGIPVSVCGEVAADPRFTPLLLGLGIHELSVASRYIPLVKNAIRNISIVAASQLAGKALTLSTAQEIQDLLNREYKRTSPEEPFLNFQI